MAAPMLTEVKINDIDIGGVPFTWDTTETYGDEINECIIKTTISIYNIIPDLEAGFPISIKRGMTTPTDQVSFIGSIDRIEVQGPEVAIYGKDKMVQLVNRTVTYSYDGIAFPSTEAKGSDIAKDLIETWGGMTASVVDTGTTILISKFVCIGASIYSRLKTIADIYGYQIRYNPSDDKVYFEPTGYNASGFTIYAGGPNNNVTGVPKWIEDSGEVINQITVKGAYQEVLDEQYFNGTFTANQVFTLGKKPITVQAWENVAGTWVLKTPGVEGSTTGTYHYTVDKENKKITCTTSWKPAVGSNNVKIVYTNAIPSNIFIEDSVSIERYGPRATEKYFQDIQTVADAESRGKAFISLYSKAFIRSTLKVVNLIGFNAGQKVSIVDQINGVNADVVINRIAKSWPHTNDELTVGDKESRLAAWGYSTLERIKRLEELNTSDSDIIVTLKSFPKDLTISRQYGKVYTRTYLDGFILGSATHGILGTSQLGARYTAQILLRLVWPDATIIENFNTTDFKDAVTTTATWTGTGSITF